MSRDKRRFAIGSNIRLAQRVGSDGGVGKGSGVGEAEESVFVEETRSPATHLANHRTRILVTNGLFSMPAPAASQLFARYEERLRMAAATLPADHVFVAMVEGAHSPVEACTLAPGEATVVGRHSEAQLRARSADVSLRHLAVAVAPGSTAAEPLIRLWDLRTGQPFTLEGGQQALAVSSDGPLFVSLGALHLAVIPLGTLPTALPAGPQALWEALPRRELVACLRSKAAKAGPHAAAGEDAGLAAAGQARPPGDAEQARSPRPAKREHITRITISRPAAAPLGCAPQDAVGELTLVCEGNARRCLVSAEDLERGVLIGRYERCMTLQDMSDRISRVHLLIAQLGPKVVAIDLASSNGSYDENQQRFSTLVLGDFDTLALAEHECVFFAWRRLSQAFS